MADRIPAPDALPECGVEREHRREPEEWQQCGDEEHGEVGQEPGSRGDRGARGGDARLEEEETEHEEDGDDERREHPRARPARGRAGRDGEVEEDECDCAGRGSIPTAMTYIQRRLYR